LLLDFFASKLWAVQTMNISNAIRSARENYQAGNLQQAEDILKKILRRLPNDAGVLFFLGVICAQLEKYDLAIQHITKSLQLDPNNAEAHLALAMAFQHKGLTDKAIIHYQKAINLDPNNAEAYNSFGLALRATGELEGAITCFQKALQLNPNIAHAYVDLGAAFLEKGYLDETVLALFKKALQINPDLADVSQFTYQLHQRTCAWQELVAMEAKLDGQTRKALDAGTKPAELPFYSIIRHADLSVNFAIAKSWSRDIAETMSELKIHFSFAGRRMDKTKSVIGYLSSDFGNHATAHLMLSLFGLHNRDEFEIFCYSYGKDDGSHYRAQIQHDCDKFVDISRLSDDAAAGCIYEDKVDILVDLKGYTLDNRIAICALRPAPIQVNYLGFPGTTGADFFDYIITDKIVTPKNHSPYYSEKFVYMPHCYQVNDHTQPISNKNLRKMDFGLPENSFLFCSFNDPYKIDLVIFDVWMKILRQVPEGVLWLIFESKIAEDNLRREAEARGVQSERLFFAGKLPKDEHLARLIFADLALDTRIVNGHTTTSDALWAGVPVMTLQGGHFASRVSSSILTALGVPELITYTIEEYERLAVRLAHNPVELQETRQRIEKNRLVAPLFDTPRFVRNLETAYKTMWEIFKQGELPRQIEVIDKSTIGK
jgi:protein O-GlcNAc transferase